MNWMMSQGVHVTMELGSCSAWQLRYSFWFGGRFLRLGEELVFHSPDMIALILLGTMAAFVYSAFVNRRSRNRTAGVSSRLPTKRRR